jgi:TetR/AcrR family transcriptional repressor of mexJK operon
LKHTVYKHFGNKQALFLAHVSAMTTFGGEGRTHEVPDPASVEELPTFLNEYAERQFHSVFAPRILRLRRLVNGEVECFPERARVLWEKGSNRAMTSMASRFSRLATRGWLVVILRPSPRYSIGSS